MECGKNEMKLKVDFPVVRFKFQFQIFRVDPAEPEGKEGKEEGKEEAETRLRKGEKGGRSGIDHEERIQG